MINIQFEADALYEALPRRFSVRNYKKQSLTEEHLSLLSQKAEILNTLLPNIKVYLMKQEHQDVFKGILGSYGKINDAPYYFVLTAEENLENAAGILGYVGEYLAAECTARAIGTCWVAGTFKKSEVMKEIVLRPHEKIFSLIAVGYQDPARTDIIKKISPSKRKPLEKLVSNLEEYSKAPSYLKECIEYARIAPSAVNRQPWQFEIMKNGIKINRSSGSWGGKVDQSKDMDLGIALFHMIVVLKHHQKKFEVTIGKNAFAEITVL